MEELSISFDCKVAEGDGEVLLSVGDSPTGVEVSYLNTEQVQKLHQWLGQWLARKEGE